MRASALADELTEWANIAGEDQSGHPELDRAAPATLRGLQDALHRPGRIGAVERIEALASSLWRDLLSPGQPVGRDDAVRFARFFADLGFLFKYKPYGVKLATPFGYSLFDLHDGAGFSYQIHLEPKWEAFHILATKPDSLLYISSLPEWEAYGQAWARDHQRDRRVPDPPAVWRPSPGDSLEIQQTGTVHAVLGCVLEEYAGCSVDAVERLFDPYSRADFPLPDRHPEPRELLAGRSHRGQPAHRLHRVEQGWRTSRPEPDDPVIDMPGELWGGRVGLAAGRSRRLPEDPELVTVLVPVDEPVQVEIEGVRLPVPPGRFACLPPGVGFSVGSDRPATVAVHRVARALVQADWSR